MTGPASVDPAQVRRIVDEARAFVDTFEQLREQAEAAGLMDWFEFHRRSIQRQWDELRGVVSHADAHRFLPVVDAIIGNGVPLEQGPPGVSIDAVNATLDALAGDRIELVRAVVGPDRYPTTEGYQQIESALRTITTS